MIQNHQNGNAQTALLLAGALIIIGAISAVLLSSSDQDVLQVVTNNDEVETLTEKTPEPNEDVEVVETMEEVEQPADLTEDTPPQVVVTDEVSLPGTYSDYDQSLLANAEDGDVLIFFHASWCPSCRTLDKDITSNLSKIPSNLTIMKVDYDTELELRKKYGVTTQHTLVKVDANGDKIETLTGLSNTLAQVEKQL